MSLYGPRVNGAAPGGSTTSGASPGVYSGLTSIPDSVSRRSTAVTGGYATCVRVTVRLFAGLRERAGWSQKEIEAATVGDVWRELDLGDEPDGLLYAVNREYAPKQTALADGDTVALIPPVSGGAFLLSDSTVSLDEVVGEVASGEAGAIATFSGTARRHSRGRTVDYLDYEAVQPRGTDWRGLFRKLTAPLVFLIGLAAKLGSLAKFAAIFVAFGGYTLIWGWRFALGVVVLIFVHELGHYVEATREGLDP